jgi:D-serine deaminase-like pyridoxal phosphate-dependent protein
MMTTIVSRPTENRIVCEGGRKTMSDHPVLPEPLGIADVAAVVLSAEHITIELARASDYPRIGDRLALVVSYVDATVHLHDPLYGARNGIVEAAWPVRPRREPSAA